MTKLPFPFFINKTTRWNSNIWNFFREKIYFGLHFAENRQFQIGHTLLHHCDVISWPIFMILVSMERRDPILCYVTKQIYFGCANSKFTPSWRRVKKGSGRRELTHEELKKCPMNINLLSTILVTFCCDIYYLNTNMLRLAMFVVHRVLHNRDHCTTKIHFSLIGDAIWTKRTFFTINVSVPTVCTECTTAGRGICSGNFDSLQHDTSIVDWLGPIIIFSWCAVVLQVALFENNLYCFLKRDCMVGVWLVSSFLTLLRDIHLFVS